MDPRSTCGDLRREVTTTLELGIRVRSELDAATETRTYTVQGQVFFASPP